MPQTPRLSIVMPVHNVARYLAECLDSILGQDFAQLEVIAVDDCSPDGSLEILRDYERKDPRVRVVALERNAGVSAARNAGLDLARGDYVWFMDSDDVLCPDTVSVLIRRADETGAEVVLFGWVRFYEDGSEKPDRHRHLLQRAPTVFAARDWPAVLRLIQVPWNKIVRRDLLQRIGMRFPEGHYEDTVFTYPLLASARLLTALPIVVLRYRQRAGAMTVTRSERHLTIFGQWRRAMAEVAAADPDGGLTPELFHVMIRHCTFVLMATNRIPLNRRHHYMKELRSLFRDHWPEGGYPARSMAERMELAIVRAGSLPLLTLYWNARASLRRRFPRGDS